MFRAPVTKTEKKKQETNTHQYQADIIGGLPFRGDFFLFINNSPLEI